MPTDKILLEQSADENLFKGQNQAASIDDLDGQFSSIGSPMSPGHGIDTARPAGDDSGNMDAFLGEILQSDYQNAPPDTRKVLANVEGFLLPPSNHQCTWWRGGGGPGVPLRPDGRLMDVLYQVALADQIRTFQALYRDNHDEHRLYQDLRERGVGPSTPAAPSAAGAATDGQTQAAKAKLTPALPTKALMSKIIEGRIRAGALCRLCYGDTSLEVLRATVDLAAAYAMQGMWEQVSEQLAIASSKLITVVTKERRAEQLRTTIRARSAAAKVECTFKVLRAHAVRNRGQVCKDVLQELVIALSALTNSAEENFLLRGGGASRSSKNKEKGKNGVEPGDRDDGRDASLAHPTQLVALLHGFFTRFAHPNHPQHAARNCPAHTSPVPSWGQVVDFLRNDCSLMQTWLEEVNLGILPQNRAILYVPFLQCDSASRGISHPAQVAFQMMRSPAGAKILGGSTLAKQLQALKIEMPLWINPRTGEVKKMLLENDIPVQALQFSVEQQFANSNQASPVPGAALGPRYTTEEENVTPTQTVLYELPVLWEEIIAMHMLELETDCVDLLRTQVMTLLGVCHIFSNKLAAAEDNMREALRQIEAMGLEQEAAACELYNSIAQLMIVKHREWQASKKARATKEATKYIQTEQGRSELKALYAQLKKDNLAETQKQAFSDISALLEGGGAVPVVSKEEREELQAKAQNQILRERYKSYMDAEEDPTLRAVEAAFRYLVRAYEIVVEAHGANHPASGTASLAVASVQNTVGNHESAREWLSRALRTFEKLEPTPHRAIAFVQVQLSQVLTKQGHANEALNVLDKAAAFHIVKAREGIIVHQQEIAMQGNYGAFTPVLHGTALHDDVTAALAMIGKLCRMIARRGGKWQAAEQAEVAAQLAEGAFGWDHLITGEALRDCGNRFVAVDDFSRAAASFKRARDTFEALNGKECKKALACARSYNRCVDNQKRAEAALREIGQRGGVETKDSQNLLSKAAALSKGKGKGKGQGKGRSRREEKTRDLADDEPEEEEGLAYGEDDGEWEDDADSGGGGGGGGGGDLAGSGLRGGGRGGGGGGSQGSSLTASPQSSPPGSPVPSPRGNEKAGTGILASIPGMVTPY